MLNVLLYNTLGVQIVYSVQLNCTDSNYKEAVWLLCWVCYCIAYWMYRQCTVCNWTVLTVITERQSDCYVECFTVQHIECTDRIQCSTERYWQ